LRLTAGELNEMETVALLAGAKGDARFGAPNGHLLLVEYAMNPKDTFTHQRTAQ